VQESKRRSQWQLPKDALKWRFECRCRLTRFDRPPDVTSGIGLPTESSRVRCHPEPLINDTQTRFISRVDESGCSGDDRIHIPVGRPATHSTVVGCIAGDERVKKAMAIVGRVRMEDGVQPVAMTRTKEWWCRSRKPSDEEALHQMGGRSAFHNPGAGRVQFRSPPGSCARCKWHNSHILFLVPHRSVQCQTHRAGNRPSISCQAIETVVARCQATGPHQAVAAWLTMALVPFRWTTASAICRSIAVGRGRFEVGVQPRFNPSVWPRLKQEPEVPCGTAIEL
jgi:hypothetical protein